MTPEKRIVELEAEVRRLKRLLAARSVQRDMLAPHSSGNVKKTSMDDNELLPRGGATMATVEIGERDTFGYPRPWPKSGGKRK